MVQSIQSPTLDLRSGPDFRVVSSGSPLAVDLLKKEKEEEKRNPLRNAHFI